VHRSITANDDRQDATKQVYLFIPSQLYMFRAMFSMSSTHPWHQPAATTVDITRTC